MPAWLTVCCQDNQPGQEGFYQDTYREAAHIDASLVNAQMNTCLVRKMLTWISFVREDDAMKPCLVRRLLRWMPVWSGGCSDGYLHGQEDIEDAQKDTCMVRRMFI
jgi:hypothetical protein